MTTIAVLALGGTVISLIVGMLWYMPNTPTGRLHMKYVGFDKLSEEEKTRLMAEMKPKMWKYYGGQMILSFITSLAVVFIVTMSMQNGVPAKMALLFPIVNWLCFMVPVLGSQIIWGNCDRSIAWKKFFSDISFSFVTVVLVAVMTAFFA